MKLTNTLCIPASTSALSYNCMHKLAPGLTASCLSWSFRPILQFICGAKPSEIHGIVFIFLYNYAGGAQPNLPVTPQPQSHSHLGIYMKHGLEWPVCI